ncbi:DJ-1/PfpI family protein [Longirhabdus pacifica]|uniref:DJ-1/PfpI family protein n=1 Tax=Longirhabdus pacifica TaxID=2305227 RepID=UPI001F0C6CA2|nr:DJ-1/PfpI family protein [Longirhabdus pacifica]
MHDDALEPYKKWRVGIFIYEGVEELDFAGPFEVFSVASYQTTMFDAPQEDKPFEVVTISKDGNGITTHNGLAITPNYSMENTPDLDILIVPGGVIEPIFYDEDISKWIGEQSKKVDILSSVCNGAFLIAKHGVLNDRTATTHWQVISVFRAYFPDVEVLENVKFVDEGDVVTSAGISAGLDMSFHLLQRLTGKEVAAQAATFMEYDIELE